MSQMHPHHPHHHHPAPEQESTTFEKRRKLNDGSSNASNSNSANHGGRPPYPPPGVPGAPSDPSRYRYHYDMYAYPPPRGYPPYPPGPAGSGEEYEAYEGGPPPPSGTPRRLGSSGARQPPSMPYPRSGAKPSLNSNSNSNTSPKHGSHGGPANYHSANAPPTPHYGYYHGYDPAYHPRGSYEYPPPGYGPEHRMPPPANGGGRSPGLAPGDAGRAGAFNKRYPYAGHPSQYPYYYDQHHGQEETVPQNQTANKSTNFSDDTESKEKSNDQNRTNEHHAPSSNPSSQYYSPTSVANALDTRSPEGSRHLNGFEERVGGTTTEDVIAAKEEGMEERSSGRDASGAGLYRSPGRYHYPPHAPHGPPTPSGPSSSRSGHAPPHAHPHVAYPPPAHYGGPHSYPPPPPPHAGYPPHPAYSHPPTVAAAAYHAHAAHHPHAHHPYGPPPSHTPYPPHSYPPHPGHPSIPPHAAYPTHPVEDGLQPAPMLTSNVPVMEKKWACDFCNLKFHSWEDCSAHETVCSMNHGGHGNQGPNGHPGQAHHPGVRSHSQSHPSPPVKMESGPNSTAITTKKPQFIHHSPRAIPSSLHPHITTSPLSSSSYTHNTDRETFLLATIHDGESLSDRQCYVRTHFVELFTASQTDVLSRHSRGAQKLHLNQVGLRCAYCAKIKPRDRAERAVCYPSSISRIYQTVADMQRFHFESCIAIPPHVLQTYKSLKTTRPRGVGSPQSYWDKSARDIGLVDSEEGIKMVVEGRKIAPVIRCRGTGSSGGVSGDGDIGTSEGVRTADHSVKKEEAVEQSPSPHISSPKPPQSQAPECSNSNNETSATAPAPIPTLPRTASLQVSASEASSDVEDGSPARHGRHRHIIHHDDTRAFHKNESHHRDSTHHDSTHHDNNDRDHNHHKHHVEGNSYDNEDAPATPKVQALHHETSTSAADASILLMLKKTPESPPKRDDRSVNGEGSGITGVGSSSNEVTPV